MVVFLFIGALVALFVLFVQPPEGAHRRQVVRDMLMGSPPAVPAAAQTVSAHSAERVASPADATSTGGLPLHHKREKSVTGLKMKEPPAQLGQPLYQLRKASMMFEKYDAATHVALPPSNATEAPKDTKRGFFRSLLARIRKGHLQANPYYTTLTDDAASNEEEVTTQRTITQRSADPQGSPKRETSESTKKRIGFQEDPLPVESSEQQTGAVTPPGPSPTKRQRRSQSIRPLGEMDFSSRGRVDRSTSVFATVAPGSSAPGLRPLKSGVKDTVTPKLGAPLRRKSSAIASRRTVNFSGVMSPPAKRSSPQRYHKVEDWRKVAGSSVSMGTEGADPSLLAAASSTSSESRPPTPRDAASRKRSRTSRADSSSPDFRMGTSKTYVMRDSTNGFRKVHHVWSQ
ncbi:uncharacterized protein LOC144127483 [Amblyomma americanum]